MPWTSPVAAPAHLPQAAIRNRARDRDARPLHSGRASVRPAVDSQQAVFLKRAEKWRRFPSDIAWSISLATQGCLCPHPRTMLRWSPICLAAAARHVSEERSDDSNSSRESRPSGSGGGRQAESSGTGATKYRRAVPLPSASTSASSTRIRRARRTVFVLAPNLLARAAREGNRSPVARIPCRISPDSTWTTATSALRHSPDSVRPPPLVSALNRARLSRALEAGAAALFQSGASERIAFTSASAACSRPGSHATRLLTASDHHAA